MSADIHAPVLFADLIAGALSHDLDRTVLVLEDGSSITAGELKDSVSRYGQFLETMTPAPQRVALLSKNRIEVPGISLTLWVNNLVSTSLHPMGALEDYLYVIADAGIDTLIYDPAHYEGIAQSLLQQAPGLKTLISIGPAAAGVDILAASRDFTPGPVIPKPAQPEDIARIAYSGGTTGKPKGIMLSQRSLVTNALIQLAEWEWPRDIRHLVCAPLSHAGAAAMGPVLVRGGSVVVLPAFEPVAFMQAVERHRITSTLMVPTMVLSLLDHPRFGEFDLSSLEVIFYGASAFPAARLKEAIGKLGPIFSQFYGQAEAPMSISLLRRAEHDLDNPERIAGCGRPTAFMKVALLDDDGREVPDGEPGEICVKSPLVMSGYLNKPEETAKAFEGGWLHTGDVAIRSPDGYLRIVDRKKDMIVTGGFNVFAREVEDVLVSHPAVRQAAVIGVPDPKWGEAVKGVVVLAPGATVDPAELIALVREQKGAVQAPKSVDFVEAIPLSPLGKPDKKALRARYAG
jgi:fatty-acyl-CoA synthase